MKFPIIIEDKKKRRLKFFIAISFIFIILESMFFYPDDENNLKIILLFGFPSLIWLIAVLYSNFKIRAYKKIADLEYKDKNLFWRENSLKFEDIKIIKITYRSYYGVWVRLNVTQGDNNEIFILTNDNKQIRFKILLENKNSLVLLTKFISILKENKVNVLFYQDMNRIYPPPK